MFQDSLFPGLDPLAQVAQVVRAAIREEMVVLQGAVDRVLAGLSPVPADSLHPLQRFHSHQMGVQFTAINISYLLLEAQGAAVVRIPRISEVAEVAVVPFSLPRIRVSSCSARSTLMEEPGLGSISITAVAQWLVAVAEALSGWFQRR